MNILDTALLVIITTCSIWSLVLQRLSFKQEQAKQKRRRDYSAPKGLKESIYALRNKQN